MRKGKITYAAIFNNGSFVEKDDFDDIMDFNEIHSILKIEFASRYTSPYGTVRDFFSFKPINIDGIPNVIKIGNFSIIHIDPENGGYEPNGFGFKIRILDYNQNIIIDFRTSKNGLSTFKDEIFPFLNKLNEVDKLPAEV